MGRKRKPEQVPEVPRLGPNGCYDPAEDNGLVAEGMILQSRLPCHETPRCDEWLGLEVALESGPLAPPDHVCWQSCVRSIHANEGVTTQTQLRRRLRNTKWPRPWFSRLPGIFRQDARWSWAEDESLWLGFIAFRRCGSGSKQTLIQFFGLAAREGRGLLRWADCAVLYVGKETSEARRVAGALRTWFGDRLLGQPIPTGRHRKLDWKTCKDAQRACLRAVVRADRLQRAAGVDVDLSTQESVASLLGISDRRFRDRWAELCPDLAWDAFRRTVQAAVDRDRAKRG